MLMIISIAFGLVHILVGMGCKFYVCLRQKDYGGAFFDTGLWMLMLIGFAVLAAGMAFGRHSSMSEQALRFSAQSVLFSHRAETKRDSARSSADFPLSMTLRVTSVTF